MCYVGVIMLSAMTTVSLMITLLFQYGLTSENGYFLTHAASDSHSKVGYERREHSP